MVEEQDFDLTTVIGVDDPGTRIDEVLSSKAGTRSDAAILEHAMLTYTVLVRRLPGGRRKEEAMGKRTGSSRHGDGNVRVDKGFAAGGDGSLLGGVEVVSGGEGGAAGRKPSLFGELLDEEGWGLF